MHFRNPPLPEAVPTPAEGIRPFALLKRAPAAAQQPAAGNCALLHRAISRWPAGLSGAGGRLQMFTVHVWVLWGRAVKLLVTVSCLRPDAGTALRGRLAIPRRRANDPVGALYTCGLCCPTSRISFTEVVFALLLRRGETFMSSAPLRVGLRTLFLVWPLCVATTGSSRFQFLGTSTSDLFTIKTSAGRHRSGAERRGAARSGASGCER